MIAGSSANVAGCHTQSELDGLTAVLAVEQHATMKAARRRMTSALPSASYYTNLHSVMKISNISKRLFGILPLIFRMTLKCIVATQDGVTGRAAVVHHAFPREIL